MLRQWRTKIHFKRALLKNIYIINFQNFWTFNEKYTWFGYLVSYDSISLMLAQHEQAKASERKSCKPKTFTG